MRALHVLHSRALWAWPLLAVELAVLNAAVLANTFGQLRTMRHLDAITPLLDLSSLAPSAWVGTLCGWPIPAAPRQRE